VFILDAKGRKKDEGQILVLGDGANEKGNSSLR